MRLNEKSFTMGQDDIKSFEEYHWAKNLTTNVSEPGDLLLIEIKSRWKQKIIEILRNTSAVTIEQVEEETTSFISESPFDEIIDRLGDDQKVSEIVKFLNQVNIAFSKRLADRIQFLLEASKEECPDEGTISPESLKNFVSFLQSVPNLKYPDVVLSPDKNIFTQWRTAPNRHFSVEFLPTDDVRFVIFAPDPKHPDKINRMSGIVSVDSLMQTVQPLGVLSWCAQ
jgi:hypothetical protein